MLKALQKTECKNKKVYIVVKKKQKKTKEFLNMFIFYALFFI